MDPEIDFLRDWKSVAAEDPYQDRPADTLVAETNIRAIPRSQQIANHTVNLVVAQARSILLDMHRVAIFWTPDRLERDAGRRAADLSGPTIVEQEAALFRAYYFALYEAYVEWAPANPEHAFTQRRKLDLVISGMQQALALLEQKASAVQARAMDLRLRYEFERLRSVITGQEMAQAIVQALAVALGNSEAEAHLLAVANRLQETVARVEANGVIAASDVSFVADLAVDEFRRRKLDPSAVRVARRLGELVTSAGLKALLVQVAEHLRVSLGL